METLPFTLCLLLASATLGTCQSFGGPGTEPWSILVATACQLKNQNTEMTMRKVQQCLLPLGSSPAAMCNKKKEFKECLKPYYNDIKKCFPKHKGDVKEALEGQKAGLDWMCEDNGKNVPAFTQQDSNCNPEGKTQKCMQMFMKESPDYTRIFAPANCKGMSAYSGCLADTFKDCGNQKMSEFLNGLFDAVLDDTPCGEGNGAAHVAFAAPLLIIALLLPALT